MDKMNFTNEMIERLAPEERILLRNMYEKVQDRVESVTEWPWTMKGPAPEEYALKVRKGVPSPQLKGGKVTARELIVAARAYEVGRASPTSLPVLHLSTPKG